MFITVEADRSDYFYSQLSQVATGRGFFTGVSGEWCWSSWIAEIFKTAFKKYFFNGGSSGSNL